MTTLHIIRGLPGSGKTTLAASLVTEDCVRVSRDDMRTMLTCNPAKQVLDFDLEDAITVGLRAIAAALLDKGISVIVDETNLRRRHVKAWVNVAAQHSADIVDHTTFDVTLDEAIERDARREHGVGAYVIRDMHSRFLNAGHPELPEPDQPETVVPYERDWSKPGVWLVDIDGTLADMGDRSPYDETRVLEDQPNFPIDHLVEAITEGSGDGVVLMSGRSEACRADTETWLHRHGIHYRALHMRAASDNRKDAVVKRELFDRHVRGQYNVLGVLDDRQQVVDMWRSLGLTCLQVAEGDF